MVKTEGGGDKDVDVDESQDEIEDVYQPNFGPGSVVGVIFGGGFVRLCSLFGSRPLHLGWRGCMQTAVAVGGRAMPGNRSMRWRRGRCVILEGGLYFIDLVCRMSSLRM